MPNQVVRVRAGVGVLAFALCAIPLLATAQSALDGFDPGANDQVRILLVQADGKTLVGGDFTTLGGGGTGTPVRNRLARLNADGSLDTSFNPGANGYVATLALQPDGKILVGGNFTGLGGGTGTTTRNNIGRLNPDGSVDLSFNPGTTGFNGPAALVVQPDGKILVSGVFTGIGGGTGTTARTSLARLNSNGSVDLAFNPGVLGNPGFYVPQVYAMALQADGKIVVSGRFKGLGGGTGATPRENIGRLNPDGSVDTTYNPGANGFVTALALQADGKIVAAGSYYMMGGGTGTTARRGIARINTDGTLDPGFNPGTDTQAIFSGLALQPDGKILLGGAFNGLGGETGTTPRIHLGRLNADGSVDPGFNPGANGSFNDYVNAFAVQPDGKVLVGGRFTGLGGGTGTTTRNYIGRLYADGSVDADLNPGATINVVNAIAVQADEKILVGGDFTGLGGGTGNQTLRAGIGRLLPDGSVDAAFNPGTNGVVNAIALQADGKILVGGSFSVLGDQEELSLGRLNPDGSVDTSFTSWANGMVNALVVQPDGKILVGGTFSTLYDDNAGVSSARNRIARLNADGSIDAGFNPGVAGNAVYTLTLQSDGKILVGGDFSGLGGGTGTTARANLGRLNADGSVDSAFNPGANSYVHAIAVQTDGKIVVGGIFIGLGGGTGTTTRNRIGRLNADGQVDTLFNPGANINVYSIAIQADGKILVGGYFTALGGGVGNQTPRSKIGRILPDGSIDPGFDPGANNTVFAMALQPDGKIVFGGYFTTLGGGGIGTVTRNRIGRVTNTDGTTQGVVLSGGGGAVKTWLRGGAAPELARATFEASNDGTNYTFLGSGTRVAGGWQVAGSALPTDQNLYLRLRGYYASGYSNGSGSIVQSIVQVVIPGAPIVTRQPTSVAAVPGRTVTFMAGATSSLAVSVQWQVNAAGSAVWANITGATGLQYSLASAFALNDSHYRAVFTNSVGTATTRAATLYVRARIANASDVDGDGLADLTVWRASTGTWYWLTSSSDNDTSAAAGQQWGSQSNGDVPLRGDMDGDGKVDLILWRATTGTWYWLTSSSGYAYASAMGVQWGNQSLGDIPMVADIDGDQKDDLIVWRASTGTWHWLTSSTGYTYATAGVRQWGNQGLGDIPMVADMDGDKKGDLVVWRASTGTWFYLTSSSGYNQSTPSSKQWGNAGQGDIPMLADLDGDEIADLVVWRPTDGTWYWLTSTTGYSYAGQQNKQWGNAGLGDVARLADMDGDGRADLVVWRSSSATWYWLTSSSGYVSAFGQQWGNAALGDVPILK